MEADFWDRRWRQNQIAFHQGRVNGMLASYIDRLRLKSGARIFVPLCGKAVDMRWLADHGYEVVGAELSPIAVRDFFQEQSLARQERDTHGFTIHEGEAVTLWCGDFFALSGQMLGEVAAVYDRAALIALPDEMRTRYIDRLLALAGPQAPILLLTYEYPVGETEGPPFSIGIDEVHERFENRRAVAVLESRKVLEQESSLRQRGLTDLTEHAFLLSPMTL